MGPPLCKAWGHYSTELGIGGRQAALIWVMGVAGVGLGQTSREQLVDLFTSLRETGGAADRRGELKPKLGISSERAPSSGWG